MNQAIKQSNQVVELNNVDFSYDGQMVLEDVTLRVSQGDFLGVVGPNGSGKSTLLKIILGLLHPTRGSVSVFGQSPVRARRRLGYVPQHANLDASFPISVADVVLIGRLGMAPLIGRYRKSDQAAAAQAMREVGVYELRSRRFGTLSGGQKQRVLMARALAGNPDLLLLDEPTASVDGMVEHDIYELLKVLNERVTIVLVSHDVGFISSYVNRVACVNKGISCSTLSDTSSEVIEACYSGPVHMLKHRCNL